MTDLAAGRYAASRQTMARQFDVALCEVRTKLTGRAFVKQREIEVPWPTTTRKRLYIVAHEIGHVVLGHAGNRLPAYKREYQAEQFAHELLRARRYSCAAGHDCAGEALCCPQGDASHLDRP